MCKCLGQSRQIRQRQGDGLAQMPNTTTVISVNEASILADNKEERRA